MRKSGHRFSARIPRSFKRIDHVYDFGLNQSKIINVICAPGETLH